MRLTRVPALLLPLIGLGLLAGCAAGPVEGSPEACALRPVAEIAVHVIRNRPMVDAQVDGKMLHLMVDTGAEGNVLTEAAARRIGVQIDWNAPLLIIGSTGYERMYTARGRRLAIGDAVADDQNFIITPSTLRSTEAEPIDGVVGGAFLSRFDVDLDLPHSRIGLYRRRACPAGTPDWTQGFTTLVKPENWHREERRPVLDVTLDNYRFTALLDSGAQGTFITAATAAAMQLTPEVLATDPTFSVSGVTSAGDVGHLHRFKRLVIGNETFFNPRFGVIQQSSGSMGGLIGADFLRQHRVWVSYGSQQIFLATGAARA